MQLQRVTLTQFTGDYRGDTARTAGDHPSAPRRGGAAGRTSIDRFGNRTDNEALLADPADFDITRSTRELVADPGRNDSRRMPFAEMLKQPCKTNGSNL